MSTVTLRSQLLDATKRLAEPAEAQAQYLKEFGTYPNLDELALLYHDFAIAARQLGGKKEATLEALRAVRELDAKLSSFSGSDNAAEWQAPALFHSANWAQVRELAKNVVSLLEATPD
jgi:hypothetical protein